MEKKKYIPVTFSKDELNYFEMAIVIKVIDDARVNKSLFYFREYHLGIELFVEEKYFLNSVEKIKTSLSEKTVNSEFRQALTELLTVLTTTVDSGVKFVELADEFKVKLTPYFFKVM
jgi:hypothetical protein